MPEISVIIPVYQAEKTLGTAIESIQHQTFQDWELLLIDDGSKDSSGAIADRYAAEDSRIRVFHRANAGVSAARNVGLENAKGDWFAFLDADDSFEDATLAVMRDLRIQNNADLVSCAHWYLSPDGTKTLEVPLPAGVLDAQGIRKAIIEPLLGDRLKANALNGFIVRYLFSADIIRKHHILFDGPYLEDELFLLEYACYASKLATTDQPLYNYLYNPNSATHRYMADFLTKFRRFVDRKTALADKYHLDMPQWKENTLWAGILIAIGNEFAPGNSKSIKERRKAVEALCAEPDMAAAIAALHPTGMGRNKQVVADLVVGRHYRILTLLYRLKNRI